MRYCMPFLAAAALTCASLPACSSFEQRPTQGLLLHYDQLETYADSYPEQWAAVVSALRHYNNAALPGAPKQDISPLVKALGKAEDDMDKAISDGKLKLVNK